MEVNVLAEVLFGFGVSLCLGFVAWGLRMVIHSFQTVGDAG